MEHKPLSICKPQLSAENFICSQREQVYNFDLDLVPDYLLTVAVMSSEKWYYTVVILFLFERSLCLWQTVTIHRLGKIHYDQSSFELILLLQQNQIHEADVLVSIVWDWMRGCCLCSDSEVPFQRRKWYGRRIYLFFLLPAVFRLYWNVFLSLIRSSRHEKFGISSPKR